jgi:hypothetical protein
MAYSAARYFAPTYFDRYFQTGASSDPGAISAALTGTGSLAGDLTAAASTDRGGDGGRFRGRLKRKQEDYNRARVANYRRQQKERDLLKVLLGDATAKAAAKPDADQQKKHRNNAIDMALIMALLEDGDE